ncbi:MAG: electron transport complex protein RnfC [Desulfobacteraceae bacterium]|nr:electron transport complex protein RnfC [Desulfobacteraceae bacterium]MBU4001171.1 electron transport complex protein RnfC [Pseudomonadota bacterium]MBU4055276.1 electron transport complex protein RnfC [Pseudomonadota bacterium]
MIKRPFICLTKPRIQYELMGAKAEKPKEIPVPKTVTLLLDSPMTRKDTLAKPGDSVKTGQKIMISENAGAYVISSATGKITGIAPYYGDYGKSFTAVTIAVSKNEEMDGAFAAVKEAVSMGALSNYLSFSPGSPNFECFSNSENPIKTIVIYGGNTDLLIATNQYIIHARMEDIIQGIDVLKKATGVEKVVIAVPRDLIPGFGHTGAEAKGVDIAYPSAMPKVIMEKVLHMPVPAGKTCEDLGVTFMSAEAVASLGKAFTSGHIPVEKILTLVEKDGTKNLVSARMGTPVGDILKAFKVTLQEKDRLIVGGPLTGSCIYSEDHPVTPDMDSIMVQDAADVSLVSDYPCVNCGECVKICPAKIQVHMLVRLLEAGLYQQAVDEYDLNCCIDCGLCSFVCVSKIPVFQYIKLAKYELDRINAAEATK